MKNTKAIALGICAVLLVAMTGGIAIAAEGNAIEGADDGVSGTIYYVDMTSGGYYATSSALYADYPDDYDIFRVTVGEGCVAINFAQTDCCLIGDTMGFGIPPTVVTATSPKVGTWGGTLSPGTYDIISGYAKCPGGYPAGYYMQVVGYWG
jgi:hypothetical protein